MKKKITQINKSNTKKKDNDGEEFFFRMETKSTTPSPDSYNKLGMDCLKLYTLFRNAHKNLVFAISRSCDTKMYGYCANRIAGDMLQPENEVSCFSVECPDFHAKSDIAPVLLNNFYKLHVSGIPNTKKYHAKIAGFPDRVLTLHLKKNSSPTKNDGNVTSTATLNVAGTMLENVQVFCIHKFMTFDALERPDVTGVVVFGCINKTNVPETMRHKFHAISQTQYLVYETIAITDEIKNRFNAITLLKDWLLQQ